jgi:hypothetical protein
MFHVKPKGRPPQEQRIIELEQKVQELGNAVLDLNARLGALEGHRAALSQVQPYEPVFQRWGVNGR